ncbi:MAG: hypothetical protein Q9170_005378 [Blastenia crenularia]
MARLNTVFDSDDELPDLSTILAKCNVTPQKQQPEPSSPTNNAKPSKLLLAPFEEEKGDTRTLPAQSNDIIKKAPLKLAHVDSLLISLTDREPSSPKRGSHPQHNIRSHPRTAGKGSPKGERKFRRNVPAVSDSSDNEDAISDHMSDFIVPDSDSDESWEDDTRRNSVSFTKYSTQNNDVRPSSKVLPPSHTKKFRSESGLGTSQEKSLTINKNQYLDRKRPRDLNSPAFRDTCEDESERPNPILKFSPPRLKSPSRSPPINTAKTPPTSPSKAKLLSPSKRTRIPPSPHRPSVDAFWSQEVINDWNDQHSPRKPKSSQARRLQDPDEDDENYLSPCEAGRRNPSKSPSKRDKQAAEKRKAFNEMKYSLATSFLEELDRTIVNGQIATLAESTGGVRLLWSKKLQSTAGRANWKREAIRTKSADGTLSTTRYRHHASIELAEKVIDNEDRLINVLAHEYCHLLNFMISNVKDHPHGKEFKIWARKCSAAFAHRGINVTTKHTYEISYNKSIDPRRHSCGKCKEKLVQVKPVPRGEGKGISEYQKFVKEHYSRVKKDKPAMAMGEVMTVLGREFREMKALRKEEVVVVEQEVVEVGESDEGKEVGLDSAVKKLDFLNLGPK